MIHPERIIVISVLAGIVAGGFTWFGWGLLQNIFAALRAPAPAAKPAAQEGEPAPREGTKPLGK